MSVEKRRGIRRVAAWAAASLCLACATLVIPPSAPAQETPYFVTYSHHLEEPGNLEIEFSTNYATQKGGNDFVASWVEFRVWSKGVVDIRVLPRFAVHVPR